MTDYKIKKKQALQAIKTLKLLVGKFFEDSSKKKPLLEDETDRSLFLQITLKKVPSFKTYQMIKVPLPHSLITDSTDVCLITGDLDKRNHNAEIDPVILHYKEILEKNHITKITEVIPLRQLRTEYKSYESKRHLLGAFDVFLADNVIAGCLPKILGKCFFKKRKFPIQINMKTKNLKEQVEKALSQTIFFFSSRGNSCASEIAYLHMTDKEILKNLIASVKILSEKIPGGFDNILGMYIKTAKSKAIPIYMSFANPNDVVLEQVRQEQEVEVAELSTLPDANVRVFRDGRVKIEKNKESSEEKSTEHERKHIPEESDLWKKQVRREEKVKTEELSTLPDNGVFIDGRVEIEETSGVISTDNEIKHKPEPPFKIEKESDLLNDEEVNESHTKEELDIVENNLILGEKYSLSSKKKQKRKRNHSKSVDESANNTKASVVLPQEHNELPSSKKRLKSKINMNENDETCSQEETNSSESNRIQSNKVLIGETDNMYSTKRLKKKISKKKHMPHNEPGENANAGKLRNHQKTKLCETGNILTCNDLVKVQQKGKRRGTS